jgi:hypothetical protein
VERFGALPLARLVADPPPGQGTEVDVIRLRERQKRLCELVDGILVEKTVGNRESGLAILLGHFLLVHVRAHDLTAC